MEARFPSPSAIAPPQSLYPRSPLRNRPLRDRPLRDRYTLGSG
ncbi:hypothetical protein [Leptolyngbya sp. O-77]|nr:hypothetical protein [Leptolyngbya sp. O-77]